jgi:parvulin-like peptidyl-prolyl isomerase
MLNAIAVIVEGEPITTVEIQAVKQQYGISKEKAIQLLIQDRLQQFAMKDIEVKESLIDDKIKIIAKQNNLSVPKMQKILKEQGMSWSKYRDSIRKAIKKEEFFKKNIVAHIPEPTEEELQQYYQTHKETFFLPKYIEMIEYHADSKKALTKFLRTNKTSAIKEKHLKKETKALNPALLVTLLQTKDGMFTKIFNAGDTFITYKVIQKEGKVPMSYEEAKNTVIMQWRQQQKKRLLKEYFEKMKTNADVQYLR